MAFVPNDDVPRAGDAAEGGRRKATHTNIINSNDEEVGIDTSKMMVPGTV